MKLTPLNLSARITLLALSLLVAATLLIGVLDDRNQRETALARQSAQLTTSANAINTQLRAVVDTLRHDVIFLSRSPAVKGLVNILHNDGEASPGTDLWRQRTSELLLAFAAARPAYFQVRILGLANHGRELVRIERQHGRLFVTPDTDLQSKEDRDYFAATMALAPGDVYLSEINLNREHGRVEPERRRTLRAATPLYTPEGDPVGLAIINLDIGPTFDEFTLGPDAGIQTYITNERGDYLVHPNPSRTFSFDFNRQHRLQDDFPALAPLYGPDRNTHQAVRTVVTESGPYRLLFSRYHFDPREPQRSLAVALAFPESIIKQQLASGRGERILATGLIGLLAAVLILSLLHHLLRPLHQLIGAARQIGRGEYDVHLPARVSGELAILSDALTMASQAVRSREQDLQTLNTRLEQRVTERTRELRAQQLRQQLILDNIGDGVIVVDAAGNFLLWSDRATALLGMGPAELPGEQWQEHYGLYHPDGTPLPPEELPTARALCGESLSGIELLVRNPARPDGIHLNVSGRPLIADDGSLLGAVVTLYDVTERDALAEQVMRTRNRLTHLLSASPVILYSVRADEYAPSFISANVEDILGYAAGEIIGNADWWRDNLHPDDRAAVLAQTDSSTWPDQRIRRRYRLRHRNGSYLWLEDQCIVTQGENGQSPELIGSMLDITHTISAGERLEKIAHNVPGAVYQYRLRPDGTSCFPYASEGLQDIYGLSPREVSENADLVFARIHPDDISRVTQSIIESAAQLTTWGCEYRICLPQHEIWVEGNATPEREADGSVLWHGYIREITARKKTELALRDSTEQLANAQRIAHIGSWNWDITAGTLAWSDEIYRIFGLQPQKFSATYEAFLERVHPDDRQKVSDGVNAALARERDYRVEHRVVRPDGTERIVLEQGEIRFNDAGEPVQMLGVVHDITERRQVEETLHLLAGVFEHSNEGILITDTDMVILQVNQAFSEITGYSAAEAIGQTPRMLSSGWHKSDHYQQMWNSLRTSGQWQGEMWDRRKDGEVYVEWLSISAIRNNEGEISNYIGIFYDITEKKRTERHIRQLAYHDSLTGLANRRLFEDRLDVVLRQTRRSGKSFALLYIDLDRFKPVNDSLGHKAGDMLLKEVSKRLKEEVRESDTVARLGGDEFALLLDQITETDAAHIAQKLLSQLRQPFMIEGTEIFIGASIGISLHPNDGDDSQTLMKHADIAMYRAKAEGRDNAQFFRPEMTAGAAERLLLENALRYAIQRNELELYYQPQIRLSDGAVTGCEALIRWHHPEWGMVSPARFIPIAEESGLIDPIGRWVLQEACRQARAWDALAPDGFRIAVNLSARQFRPRLIELMREDLAQCGGDPRRLALELTESMVMDDPEAAIAVMQELNQLGFQLAIDDFGTGYSSLAYLKRFPIHKIKVDQEFVRDLPADGNDAAIVATAISLAHNMQLDVIAEGVETAPQITFLRELGCGEIQGYYCSPPRPAAEFEQLLRLGRCELP